MARERRGEERRGGSGNTGNNPNLTIQSFTFCNGVDKNYFLFVFVFMYIYFMPGTWNSTAFEDWKLLITSIEHDMIYYMI